MNPLLSDPRDPDQDLYDPPSGYYYALHVLLIVYGLGFILSLQFVQNATVTHTYFRGSTFGTLFSLRYASMYWFSLFFSCMRIFIFLCMCCMLLFRNTMIGKSGFGCTIFWVILLLCFVILDIMGFAMLGTYYSRCNGIGQVDNPCNDLRWCCVNEIFTDSANFCYNTAGCTPAVLLSDLHPNPDFLWLFWTSVFFIAFDLVFLLIPVGIWLANNEQKIKTQVAEGRKPSAPPLEEGGEEEEIPPTKGRIRETALQRKLTKQT